MASGCVPSASRLACLVHRGWLEQVWHMVPKGDTLDIGVSLSLLFDVLPEIPLSCEAVCFFFLPKPGLGVAWGQVEGGKTKGSGT